MLILYMLPPCLSLQPVLHFICQSARYHGLRKAPCGTFLSFYAVVLCEVAAGLPAVSEDVLSQLLGYLVDGLSGDASPDYRSATLMAVAELCSRATLGRDFLKGEQGRGGGQGREQGGGRGASATEP